MFHVKLFLNGESGRPMAAPTDGDWAAGDRPYKGLCFLFSWLFPHPDP